MACEGGREGPRAVGCSGVCVQKQRREGAAPAWLHAQEHNATSSPHLILSRGFALEMKKNMPAVSMPAVVACRRSRGSATPRHTTT